MDIIKASTEDTGCWIDGNNGVYMNALIILEAQDYGYDNEELINAARKDADNQIYPSRYQELTEQERTLIDEELDNVIEWMNENVAPKGFAFGTYEGDFFFASDEWWKE